MIESLRHNGLRRFLFVSGDAGGLNAQHTAKFRRMLAILDAAESPDALDLPGYRLHPLKGDRRGQWAAWVSGNWRLVFGFRDGQAISVDLVDYH